ncbi:MAG: hypothetical protein LUC97_01700 [Clostridiales bacterium]|nr:hypothetical protein [Clostridiales bacterium]
MENYYVVLLFIIYSFLGWVLEVGYSAVKKGKLINRGFLNGSWCPIYGFGTIIILYLLTSLEDNILLLFIGSVLSASLLEFLTGFVLQKIYNTRWWDYTDRPFNIKGYVCLECSLFWGLAGVLLIKVLNPLIEAPIRLIPLWLGLIITVVLTAVFIFDCIMTVLAMNNLCSRLERLDKMAAEIRSVSDELSVSVYEKATDLKELKDISDVKLKTLKDTNEAKLKELKEANEAKLKNIKLSAEESEARLKELREKYKKLLNENKFSGKRLLTAFPNLKNEKHRSQLEKLLKRGE